MTAWTGVLQMSRGRRGGSGGGDDGGGGTISIKALLAVGGLISAVAGLLGAGIPMLVAADNFREKVRSTERQSKENADAIEEIRKELKGSRRNQARILGGVTFLAEMEKLRASRHPMTVGTDLQRAAALERARLQQLGFEIDEATEVDFDDDPDAQLDD